MPPLTQTLIDYPQSSNKQLDKVSCFSYSADIAQHQSSITKLIPCALEAATVYGRSNHNYCAIINHDLLLEALKKSNTEISDVTSLYTEQLGPHQVTDHHITLIEIGGMCIVV